MQAFDDNINDDCDVEDKYMLFTRDGDNLNSTWTLEDDTRCPPAPSRFGGAYGDSEDSVIFTPEPSPTPIEESSASTAPWIIVISVLIPLLFCVLPLAIYIYLRHKRSSKDQAEDISSNNETERMLALKCPVCSVVTDENYFLIPCGHFACAKCSAEYESKPCPTCHGTLTGRHKVTCKTSLA